MITTRYSMLDRNNRIINRKQQNNYIVDGMEKK